MLARQAILSKRLTVARDDRPYADVRRPANVNHCMGSVQYDFLFEGRGSRRQWTDICICLQPVNNIIFFSIALTRLALMHHADFVDRGP